MAIKLRKAFDIFEGFFFLQGYFSFKNTLSIFVSMKPSNPNPDLLNTLCEKHSVENLYLFGSVLTNSFSEESDVDFLVEFQPMDLWGYFDNFLSLKSGLESITQRKVDLLELQTVKNPVLLKSINNTKQLIYGRKNSEVPARYPSGHL